MTINFYKFIGCTGEKKKCACIFLGVFPTAGNNNEKKIKNKKNFAVESVGLLPKLYYEKNKILCCKIGLYCEKKKKGLAACRVYCNTLRQLGRFCIAGWKGHGRQGLYHNTLSVS